MKIVSDRMVVTENVSWHAGQRRIRLLFSLLQILAGCPEAKGLKQVYLKNGIKAFLLGNGFIYLYYFKWFLGQHFSGVIQFLEWLSSTFSGLHYHSVKHGMWAVGVLKNSDSR